MFEEEKTYGDAQRFCEASNWTLAALKDSDTNKFVTNMMQAVGANDYYIGLPRFRTLIANKTIPQIFLGVHEKFNGLSLDTSDDTVTYLLDNQPVGSFQPWYNAISDADIQECIIGRGFDYDGSLNITALGNECT